MAKNWKQRNKINDEASGESWNGGALMGGTRLVSITSGGILLLVKM